MTSAHRLKVAAGAFALAAATAACGRQGALARPAPLFGEQAHADYQAEQASQSRAATRRATAARRSGATTAGTRANPDPTATDSSTLDPDNAPPTTRDIEDPAQKLNPISRAPAAGAPDPLGSPVSVTPPY